MRALVTRLRADGRREKTLVADWPEPAGPIGNQIKIRTRFSGITNGTERNDLVGGNYATPDHRLPSALGYQNVGEVIEIGPEVAHLKIGDVVFSGAWLSSDHLEYVVLPEDDLLIRLPVGIDPKHAALFGVASVAMHSCRNADLGLGEQVLIVGQGCAGQFAAQTARAMGARVSVCDVDARRLSLARDIGAAEAVMNTSDDRWAEQIIDGAYDAVIDFAGLVDIDDHLLSAVRRNGRVILVAGRSKVRYDFNLGQAKQITLKQLSHFETRDLAAVCRLVEQGTVRIGPVLQDVVPVSEAARIYDILRDSPGSLMGTVFEW